MPENTKAWAAAMASARAKDAHALAKRGFDVCNAAADGKCMNSGGSPHSRTSTQRCIGSGSS